MLIRFFRSSFLIQHIALVLLAVLLWFPSFLNPAPPANISDGYSPVYLLFYSFFSSWPFITTILAFLLMLFQAFYFNDFLASNHIVGRASSSGTFVYILLMSLSPQQSSMYPLLLAMPFVLFAMKTLFLMYDTNENEFNILNASLYVSLASLIYFPLITLVGWLYFSLFILRISKVREWIIPAIGIVVPYFFLGFIYFMNNVFISKFQSFGRLPENILPIPQLPPGVLLILILTVLLFMVFQALSVIYGAHSDRNIANRKRKAITNALMFFSITMLFYKWSDPMQHALILLPASVYLAHSHMLLKRFFWPQLFIIVLILLSLALHYSTLSA
ncbi:MAG: hypothetical protein Q8J88_03985 [Bacteroidales bacterium]|nr:hypothetical protein [Bacteroidales bacterium]